MLNRYRLTLYAMIILIFLLIQDLTNWQNKISLNYLFIGICCAIIYFLGYLEREKEEQI